MPAPDPPFCSFKLEEGQATPMIIFESGFRKELDLHLKEEY